MRIAVYGSAVSAIKDIYKTKVFELGRLLAERGHSLVFGGGDGGLMGEAARGFASRNGKILGVVPLFFKDASIEDLYPESTAVVNTETMHDRKEIMEQNADAFVITPGGIGTYDEFFSALTNKNLGRHCKPIAVYNIDGYFDPLVKFLEISVEKCFVNPSVLGLYKCFTDPEELIKYIEESK